VRSLIVSCNVSADGYMSGPGHEPESLSFIVPDPEQENDLAARFESTVDAIVLGRRTFFVMEDHWTKVDSAMAAWLSATPKIVLSTDPNLDVSIWQNSTLAAGDAVEQVQRLKETEGRAMVTFGGVQAIRSLVGADLVDEFWLKISPVAIGEGSSMFSTLPDRRDLALQGVKAYASGMIDVTYARP
jgi:dihydrofolate reductase